MPLKIKCDTALSTFDAKGRIVSKAINDLQIADTVRLGFQMTASLSQGAAGSTEIRVYDSAGNLVKQTAGGASAGIVCNLRPNAVFADNSTGNDIDMDLDEATYGPGSKVEVSFAGTAGQDSAQIGAGLIIGTSQFGLYFRDLDGAGKITYTFPFEVKTEA